MPFPNLLILGAAKSATTSLYRYLAQHPDVFMSPVKEPSFFIWGESGFDAKGPGLNELRRRVVTDLSEYQKLFDEATSERVLGEASTGYLHTPGVPVRIRRCIPEAKLMAILRNPIDRAYSAFLHARDTGMEPIRDFEQALAQESARVREGWIGLTHYTNVGKYAEQIARYANLFPSEQMRIYLYDDLNRDPRAVVRDAYRFLRVDAEFDPDLNLRYNVRTELRWEGLRPLAKSKKLRRFTARLLPEHSMRRMSQFFKPKTQPRHELSLHIRDELAQTFAEDVRGVSAMIGRDLSPWLEGRSIPPEDGETPPGRHPRVGSRSI